MRANAPDRILLRETDDNAIGGLTPSRRPLQRRISQPIASYRPSKWVESGTPRADTETPIVYKYLGWPGSGSAFFYNATESLFDLSKARVQRRPPRIENNVPLRANIRAMEPERRAQAPLNSIADDCSPNRARDGEPQAGTSDRDCARLQFRSWPRPAKCGEQGTGNTEALVIGGAEFGGVQDSRRLRESKTGAFSRFSGLRGRLVHR
jgi:hypothetical protein